MNSHDDVLTFMDACEQKERGLDSRQALLYRNLICEEFTELMKAVEEHDMVEIADACADLKWVIEGLEHTLNLPNQEIWNEVARSNLSKISPSGKVIKREDGKILKPLGWTPPDIKQVLESNRG